MSLTIAQQLELLQNIKANIKAALKRQGANITDDTPFSDYAGLIGTGTGGGIVEEVYTSAITLSETLGGAVIEEITTSSSS